MARYVIDALTLVHILDEAVQLDPAHQLVAPSSIRSEAMQVLLADVCAGQRTDRQAVALHRGITEIKLRTLGDRVSRATAWQLAREHGWETLRDAEYLAVATLQADALVTVDERLAERARDLVPTGGVDLLRTDS